MALRIPWRLEDHYFTLCLTGRPLPVPSSQGDFGDRRLVLLTQGARVASRGRWESEATIKGAGKPLVRTVRDLPRRRRSCMPLDPESNASG